MFYEERSYPLNPNRAGKSRIMKFDFPARSAVTLGAGALQSRVGGPGAATGINPLKKH